MQLWKSFLYMLLKLLTARRQIPSLIDWKYFSHLRRLSTLSRNSRTPHPFENDDKIYSYQSKNVKRLKNRAKTRLHSSRMHTRSLTVSPSMLCSGGCLPGPGGGVCLLGPGWSCLVLGGGCLPGPKRGVPAWSGGGGIPSCTKADPPVNRITDACENTTLPQLRCGR